MITIKKLNVLSIAKLIGLISLFVGLIEALIHIIVRLVLEKIMWNVAYVQQFYFSIYDSQITLNESLFILILLPLLYGIFSFISACVVCWLYNVFSEKIGGFEVEIKK